MTPKERILAALNGQPTDTLPFIPRLDIWYNANAGNGTLPAPYQHATLRHFLYVPHSQECQKIKVFTQYTVFIAFFSNSFSKYYS